ncbi:hypothetical protein [Rhizobium leguminosarum]|uniref:hypothetical protein n=1 Tax=Rhizobium leguminosarum TaxID=384 RepID=UPI0014411EC9|nr:hypothetical protein [Rhizobium leguminosarum]NKL94173.1 hypothetical protein [Rhizobium leguminosarum bv. viciae]
MSEIFVGVDTNILCNFGRIEGLNWKTIFPEATSINVLISAKVQSEMDVHKDTASGYVQKRAREYQKLLKKAEDADYSHSFESFGMSVRLIFLDRPRRNDLDDQKFDVDRDDERIVAEYYYEQDQRSVDIIIVANDARPIRVARQAGMAAIRPDRWDTDRSEPEDEIVRELRERVRQLERIQGARPKTKLADFAINRESVIPADFSPSFDVSKYLKRLGDALKTAPGVRTPESLIDQFGLVRDNGYFSLHSGTLTTSQIDQYGSELENLFSHFDIDGLELLQRLQSLSRAIVFDFEVENVGEAPEEMLSVELKILQNAVFIDAEDMEELNDWGLAPPDPPRPRFDLSDINLVDRLTDAANRSREPEHEFVLVDDSDTTETHRCRSMLHGHKAAIETYLLPKDPNKPVSILVTLRAKNLLDPIIRKVEIARNRDTVDETFVSNFLRCHSVFMPEEQRDIVLSILR